MGCTYPYVSPTRRRDRDTRHLRDTTVVAWWPMTQVCLLRRAGSSLTMSPSGGRSGVTAIVSAPERARSQTVMVTTFFYSLAGGMLAVVATARIEQIAWRFLRLVGLVVFAIACGVTIWNLRSSGLESATTEAREIGAGAALAVAAMAVVFTAPFATRIARAFRLSCMLGGLMGIWAACISALARLDNAPHVPLGATSVIIGQVLGAVLLGSITVTWLLGHAYLTATRMTIAPLRHFSRMLALVVAIRVGFLIVSLAVAWSVGYGMHPSILACLGQAWLVLLLRVGFGLVAVGAFTYMVLDCVRRRATQSATGILYFGSIFAYVGELANQQLITECGWSL